MTTNWKILKEMGIPDHLTCLLRNLYAGQEATVRTGHGTMDWFKIGKGECQRDHTARQKHFDNSCSTSDKRRRVSWPTHTVRPQGLDALPCARQPLGILSSLLSHLGSYQWRLCGEHGLLPLPGSNKVVHLLLLPEQDQTNTVKTEGLNETLSLIILKMAITHNTNQKEGSWPRGKWV